MKKENFYTSNNYILSIVCLLTLTTSNTNASEYIPTLGENSAYTFTSIENISDKTLTVYQQNNDSGIVNAINYELGLKKTEYGSGDYSKTYSI